MLNAPTPKNKTFRSSKNMRNPCDLPHLRCNQIEIGANVLCTCLSAVMGIATMLAMLYVARMDTFAGVGRVERLKEVILKVSRMKLSPQEKKLLFHAIEPIREGNRTEIPVTAKGHSLRRKGDKSVKCLLFEKTASCFRPTQQANTLTDISTARLDKA